MDIAAEKAGASRPSPGLVVLTSRKGGTGKSTAAVCLAAALAQKGEKVLLCDLDFACRADDLLLGCENDVLFDLGDLAAGRADAARCTVPVPGCEGLWLLPAPLADGPAEDPEAIRRAVKTAAAALGCTQILADTRADSDPAALALFPEADLVLSVTTSDPAALRGSEALAYALDAAGARCVKLLVNRFDADAVLGGTAPGISACIDRTHTELFGVIPESEALRRMGAGRPLNLTDGKRGDPTGTDGAFGRLAARLLGEEQPLLASLAAKKRRRLLES